MYSTIWNTLRFATGGPYFNMQKDISNQNHWDCFLQKWRPIPFNIKYFEATEDKFFKCLKIPIILVDW